jgi:hypothetical protein
MDGSTKPEEVRSQESEVRSQEVVYQVKVVKALPGQGHLLFRGRDLLLARRRLFEENGVALLP